MALSHRSVVAAAGRKTRQVKAKLVAAEAQLASANEDLKSAIPSANVRQIAKAFTLTTHAEKEVADAAEELEVVATLLEDDTGGPTSGSAGSSGEGVKSLTALLKRQRESK